MKRLSVSLLAVVAIIFAVASAFTTVTADAGWYKVSAEGSFIHPGNPAIDLVSTADNTADLTPNCTSQQETACVEYFDGSSFESATYLEGGPYSN